MKVEIPIESFRTDASRSWWELPTWGHPLSQGVFPLFMSVKSRLIPIGTAFSVGHGIAFIISAEHNARATLNEEQRLRHLRTVEHLPEAITFREVGLYLLYQRWSNEARTEIQVALWPLETFAGAPPTDVVFGSPQFQAEVPTLDLPLCFEAPPQGERVWSIGYTNFKVPDRGIPLEAVDAGAFDWRREYSHSFRVVEGRVDRIFVQRFASKFVDGPCFTFDAEIFPGQSGGPVLDTTGRVRGVNSAGASNFFDRPMSIASFIYPILFQKLRTGAQLGPTRLEITRPIFEWIARGHITTDGSEAKLCLTHDGDSFAVGFSAPKSFAAFIHEDFAGLQRGMSAPEITGDHYRLRQKTIDAQ